MLLVLSSKIFRKRKNNTLWSYFHRFDSLNIPRLIVLGINSIVVSVILIFGFLLEMNTLAFSTYTSSTQALTLTQIRIVLIPLSQENFQVFRYEIGIFRISYYPCVNWFPEYILRIKPSLISPIRVFIDDFSILYLLLCHSVYFIQCLVELTLVNFILNWLLWIINWVSHFLGEILIDFLGIIIIEAHFLAHVFLTRY